MRGIERELGKVYEIDGYYFLEKVYEDLADLMSEEREIRNKAIENGFVVLAHIDRWWFSSHTRTKVGHGKAARRKRDGDATIQDNGIRPILFKLADFNGVIFTGCPRGDIFVVVFRGKEIPSTPFLGRALSCKRRSELIRSSRTAFALRVLVIGNMHRMLSNLALRSVR